MHLPVHWNTTSLQSCVSGLHRSMSSTASNGSGFESGYVMGSGSALLGSRSEFELLRERGRSSDELNPAGGEGDEADPLPGVDEAGDGGDWGELEGGEGGCDDWRGEGMFEAILRSRSPGEGKPMDRPPGCGVGCPVTEARLLTEPRKELA